MSESFDDVAAGGEQEKSKHPLYEKNSEQTDDQSSFEPRDIFAGIIAEYQRQQQRDKQQEQQQPIAAAPRISGYLSRGLDNSPLLPSVTCTDSGPRGQFPIARSNELPSFGSINFAPEFAVKMLENESIGTTVFNGRDIKQGAHGDCVFEATLSAMAKTDTLQQMIVANKDGSYTVTFPGDKDHPVLVTAEDLRNYKSQNPAKWARIAETAMLKQYPKFSDGGFVLPGAPGGSDGHPPTAAQFAMFLLSGKTAEKIDASDACVGEKISSALDKGWPVVAFCKSDAGGALSGPHEWTMEGYDPKKGQIILRDPRGEAHKKYTSSSEIQHLQDGEVRMSLSTFKKYFGEVTWGEPPDVSILRRVPILVARYTAAILQSQQKSLGRLSE